MVQRIAHVAIVSQDPGAQVRQMSSKASVYLPHLLEGANNDMREKLQLTLRQLVERDERFAESSRLDWQEDETCCSGLVRSPRCR